MTDVLSPPSPTTCSGSRLEAAAARPQLGLEDVAYESGRLEFHRPRATEPESVLPRYLDDASRIVSALELSPPASADVPALSPTSRTSAGFRLPNEALAELRARRRANRAATDL